jgi:hypothetical protein
MVIRIIGSWSYGAWYHVVGSDDDIIWYVEMSECSTNKKWINARSHKIQYACIKYQKASIKIQAHRKNIQRLYVCGLSSRCVFYAVRRPWCISSSSLLKSWLSSVNRSGMGNHVVLLICWSHISWVRIIFLLFICQSCSHLSLDRWPSRSITRVWKVWAGGFRNLGVKIFRITGASNKIMFWFYLLMNFW